MAGIIPLVGIETERDMTMRPCIPMESVDKKVPMVEIEPKVDQSGMPPITTLEILNMKRRRDSGQMKEVVPTNTWGLSKLGISLKDCPYQPAEIRRIGDRELPPLGREAWP